MPDGHIKPWTKPYARARSKTAQQVVPFSISKKALFEGLFSNMRPLYNIIYIISIYILLKGFKEQANKKYTQIRF